jgi:hypothetical protein
MSVLRQLNLLGQMRLDVPHLRSVESSIAADFDVVAGRVQAGDAPVVIRGFALANFASGTAANSVQLSTADGILYNVNASEAGTFLWVPADRNVETLNSATNPRVDGSFTAGQVNYIGLDLTRSSDPTTSDLAQFLDPNTLLESPKTVPLGRTLDYRIVISTTPFSASPNLVPIAKITTDSSNNVAAPAGSVQDARNILWRLGSGGDFPDRLSTFSWGQGRVEPTTGLNVFTGGDKSIQSQKGWMDAIMTRLWELGGGENWYSTTADRNVRMVRVPSPVFASTGDNFEFVGGNIRWQSLRIAFDNANGAGVYFNTIVDQTSNLAGLTDIADGECIYVDIDRTSNSALTAKKAALQTLSVPVIPGSRFIIAWRLAGNVYTRDSSLAVNVSFQPATSTVAGAVRLNQAANPTHAGAGVPTVLVLDANNAVAIGQAPYAVVGSNAGLTVVGGTSGIGVQGTGGGAFSSTAAGVRGIHAVPDAMGVWGTTQGFVGVRGEVVSGGAGTGVQGFAATGIGVQGNASGLNGRGVVGIGGASGTAAHGVQGLANSASEAGSFVGWQPGGAGISANGGTGLISAGGPGSTFTMSAARNGGLGIQAIGGAGSATNDGGAGADAISALAGAGGSAAIVSGFAGAGGRGIVAVGGSGGNTTSPINAGAGGAGASFTGGQGGSQSTILFGTGGPGVVATGGAGGNSSGSNPNGAGIVATGGGHLGTGGSLGAAGGIFQGTGGVSTPGVGVRSFGGDGVSFGVGGIGVESSGGNGTGSGAGGIGIQGTGGNGTTGDGGVGVRGFGGNGSTVAGVGVLGTGGTPNGTGVRGVGGGTTGIGVSGTGGTNGAGASFVGNGTGHGIEVASTSGKAIAITTNTNISYPAGRTMKYVVGGSSLKYNISTDNNNDRVFLDGSSSSQNRLGLGAPAVTTNLQLYHQFNLPQGAVITQVRIAVNHSGAAGGCTANFSMQKMVRSDTIGSAPFGWTATPVFSVVNPALALAASSASEIFTPTINATPSNRTVTGLDDVFALDVNSSVPATTGSFYVIWIEVTYTMFDILNTNG